MLLSKSQTPKISSAPQAAVPSSCPQSSQVLGSNSSPTTCRRVTQKALPLLSGFPKLATELWVSAAFKHAKGLVCCKRRLSTRGLLLSPSPTLQPLLQGGSRGPKPRGANRDPPEVTTHPGAEPGGPTQAPQSTPPPPHFPRSPASQTPRPPRGLAARSARRPCSPYRRATERRTWCAGCGPGRLRRGEQQQVGVVGARGRRGWAHRGRRSAGVLRRRDDDDL